VEMQVSDNNALKNIINKSLS